MVEPIFHRSAFEVVAGAPKIYSARSTGSGKQVSVHFCPDCGTKICLTFERFPDVVGVYAGTFDNPSWFERKRDISACLFVGSAQEGALIPAGIPVFRAHRTADDGSPNTPEIFDAPFEIKRA